MVLVVVVVVVVVDVVVVVIPIEEIGRVVVVLLCGVPTLFFSKKISFSAPSNTFLPLLKLQFIS